MSENKRYAFGDKSNGNKILQSNGKILGYGIADVPIAVYSEDNNSLTFCNAMSTPEIGSQFLGKTVTEVYTGIENTGTVSSSIPWRERIEDIRNVTIDSSFIHVQPASTAYWFSGMINCIEIDGLESLNTSNVTSMRSMFYNCSLIKKLDLHNFNTENTTTMLYMFDGCSSLTSIDISGLNTKDVENMGSAFNNCMSLKTIYSDDNNFITSSVAEGSDMFRYCYDLIGGNGTAYSSSNTNYTYAHVDVPDNPGYFTAK